MARVQYRKLAVAGGNLFRIALDQEGDALDWSRIAELNGIWDPWLAAATETLLLPPPANMQEKTGGLIGGPYPGQSTGV